MGRFKAPAPAPPSSASGTPMRTPNPLRARTGGPVVKKTHSASKLSLVAAFDDLCRNGSVLYDEDPKPEEQMLVFVRNAEEWRRKSRIAGAEKNQIATQLAEKDNELSGKLMQIKQARNYLQEERAARIKAEQERDSLQKQLRLIQNLVFSDAGHQTLSNDTLVKIRTLDRQPAANSVLSPGGAPGRGGGQHETGHIGLPVVDESVESLLDASDLSFEDTREDIMEGSRHHRYPRRSTHNTSRQQRRVSRRSSFAKRKSHEGNNANGQGNNILGNVVSSGVGNLVSVMAGMDQDRVLDLKEKVRRSRLQAEQQLRIDEETTTDSDAAAADPMRTPKVRITHVDTTPATVKRTFSNASAVAGNRPHSWQKETGILKVGVCNPCGKKFKFGKPAYKCRDCRVCAHEQCKKDVPLPCISAAGSRTPQNKACANYLADYTPIEAPMIPSIVIYCVREIEARGMEDVGIYRVAGSESDANDILDKFKRGGPPRLSKYEIHAVTSCLKKFLRQLKEPIIPLSLWQVFVDAANNPDTTDSESAMYQAISELPQPNRDTLAYLIVHLQSVAANYRENKMNVDNLATVMGPTILGNSSNDPMAIMSEAGVQKAVVRALMAISEDYWSHFLAVEDDKLMLRQAASGASPAMTPDQPIFATPLGGLTTGGPIARRTRSKQWGHNNEGFATKQQLFQSPMLL